MATFKLLLTHMKSLFFLITCCLLTSTLYAQNDSINTANGRLKFEQLPEGTNTYLVYFQDSLEGPKYNMEIWKRTINKTQREGNSVYLFHWDRSLANTSHLVYEISSASETFTPYEETIRGKRIDGDQVNPVKRHFIYQDNTISTDKDPDRHNSAPFTLSELNYSFNWEMDMETFSMLPFAEGKTFYINFYHPGSPTKPNYYAYRVTQSDSIVFNGKSTACWILAIEYPDHGKSEFWIDKTTYRILKMKELYEGRYRFKMLLPE